LAALFDLEERAEQALQQLVAHLNQFAQLREEFRSIPLRQSTKAVFVDPWQDGGAAQMQEQAMLRQEQELAAVIRFMTWDLTHAVRAGRKRQVDAIRRGHKTKTKSTIERAEKALLDANLSPSTLKRGDSKRIAGLPLRTAQRALGEIKSKV